jgi:hypothetical protein
MSNKTQWLMHFQKSLGIGVKSAIDAVGGLSTGEREVLLYQVGTQDPPNWNPKTALRRTVVVVFSTYRGQIEVVAELTKGSVEKPWKFLFTLTKNRGIDMLDKTVVEGLDPNQYTETQIKAWLEFVQFFNRGTWDNKQPSFQVRCDAFDYETDSIDAREFLATARVQMYHPTESGGTYRRLWSMPMWLFLDCAAIHFNTEEIPTISDRDIHLCMETVAGKERFLGINSYLFVSPETTVLTDGIQKVSRCSASVHSLII